MPVWISEIAALIAMLAAGMTLVLNYRNVKKTSPEAEWRKQIDIWRAHVDTALAHDKTKIDKYENMLDRNSEFQKLTLSALAVIVGNNNGENTPDEVKKISQQINKYLMNLI